MHPVIHINVVLALKNIDITEPFKTVTQLTSEMHGEKCHSMQCPAQHS